MKLIAAADKNWAIGRKNSLLVRIPNDMKNFRALTEGNVVVMGRKTLESFPGGQPLPRRVNIVLTRQADYQKKGALIVHSEEELRRKLAEYDSDRIFVIGGESIYRLLLPYCNTAYITRLDYAYEADTWMPDLDREEGWTLEEEGEEQTCFDLIYYFCIYRNASPSAFDAIINE
ncbi:MAG: dihydrofolate reductase [Eubacterium sp.]|nr:dihydrofolate reductase [Eubacterium sp.]